MGPINNRNLFLTVPEAGSSKSRCQYGQVLVKALLWVVQLTYKTEKE